MASLDGIQVIFGPTEDEIHLNGYQTNTEDQGDLYDEIVSQFLIVSCKDADALDTYDLELLFEPTGQTFLIQGYLTFAESESDIHDEVRHYLEINGFHRHRSSWDTVED